VAVMPLADILASSGMDGKKIDLMSVDVEGMDLSVLMSNDWKKYQPMVVICEDLGFDLGSPKKSEVYAFLVKQGYRLVAKTPYSLILSL